MLFTKYNHLRYLYLRVSTGMFRLYEQTTSRYTWEVTLEKSLTNVRYVHSDQPTPAACLNTSVSTPEAGRCMFAQNVLLIQCTRVATRCIWRPTQLCRLDTTTGTMAICLCLLCFYYM